MNIFLLLPAFCFIVLLLGELLLPCVDQPKCYHRLDWALNLIGLFIQGAIIPILGVICAYYIFPLILPFEKGVLPIGWWGAFFLNFILIDFLYYWQHRSFHAVSMLWNLHLCHHSAPRVDIWSTARNNLCINFLFVYLLLNPLLGYCCNNPDGFFAAAMITASLDIWRHTQLKVPNIIKYFSKIIGIVLVMPAMHRSHHNMAVTSHNFGANLIIWDKLFGSFLSEHDNISVYQAQTSKTASQQFWYPFAS